MDQRTGEPVGDVRVRSDYELEYHERQFREPYRSTVAFCDWLETSGFLVREQKLRILDLGSGAGANIYYMSQRYPGSSFVGIDINPELVERGNAFFQSRGIHNCRLEVGDLYNVGQAHVSAFDGVISLQTLSWLPDFRAPVEAISKLQPKWIALTSLFYDGPVSCTIDVTQYDDNLAPGWSGFYNVYSIPLVRKHMQSSGFGDFLFTPFEIDIDLAKPSEGRMSTYTETLEDGRRLQRSGPLLMPWYFIAASR